MHERTTIHGLAAKGPKTMTLKFEDLRRANVARLPQFRNRKGEIVHLPDGSDWTPAQWGQAVTGEWGEYASWRKQYERGDIDEETFKREAGKELADVITYIDILAYRLGIDLGDALISKFNEISERVSADVFLSDDGAFRKVERPVLGGWTPERLGTPSRSFVCACDRRCKHCQSEMHETYECTR